MKKTRMLNMKALEISSAIARVAPDLLKALAIWSDTANKKKGHISLGDQQSYYLQVFQRLYLPKKED